MSYQKLKIKEIKFKLYNLGDVNFIDQCSG